MPRKPAKSSSKAPRESLPFQWIRPLATPYLRGYRAAAVRTGGLLGYSFQITPRGGKDTLSFFVGYLLEPGNFSYLKPAPPECLIFASVEPVGGALHHMQVVDPAGTVHWTFEYIRWLTHRPPRFEFFPKERATMVRHRSMLDWPEEKYQHFAGNFFTETLAWLVRSGLVRRWKELASVPKA